MKSIKLYAILFLVAFYGNAFSAEHVVKMLNGAPPNMFVFLLINLFGKVSL